MESLVAKTSLKSLMPVCRVKVARSRLGAALAHERTCVGMVLMAPWIEEEPGMQSLSLAVKIADIVATAKQRKGPLDVDAKAARLVNDHPEAEASRSEIADTLRAESAAVGVDC